MDRELDEERSLHLDHQLKFPGTNNGPTKDSTIGPVLGTRIFEEKILSQRRSEGLS